MAQEKKPGQGRGQKRPDKGKPGSQEPEPPPGEFEPIELASHDQLLSDQARLFRRFNDNPELSTLLFINPVLAFREVGVTMTPEIAHHILHSVQHPPKLRQRRDELEASLKEALGEPPQPNDPEWLAITLFEKLNVQPLQTSGYKPTYKSEISDEIVKKLGKMRPKARKRPPQKTRSRGMRLRVKTTRPAVRRMDLDAELPALKGAKKRPNSVSLETLYFYKDSHPLARDLLELGIIRRRSFPFHSGDSYRKIKAGDRRNAFRGWIKALRFPEEGES